MTSPFRSTPQNPWNPATPCLASRQRAQTFIDYVNQLKTCGGDCGKTMTWEGNFRPTEWGYPMSYCIPCTRKRARERARRLTHTQPENYMVDDNGDKIR